MVSSLLRTDFLLDQMQYMYNISLHVSAWI